MLRIAVAKGRTEKEVLKLFERCGIYFDEHNKTRKLILRDRNEKLELILTKPVDTTVYVETGAADCGIVGKDILLENDADVYSLLSLGIARCKMCVAKKRGDDFQQNKFITVATKFPRIAKKYFDEKNIDCKIIYLSGSVELAPILNIADVIVDLVQTGTTLKENDLVVADDIIEDVCACFIANKVSLKTKFAEFEDLMQKLNSALSATEEES